MRAVAAEAAFDGRITMVGIGKSGALTGLPFVRSQVRSTTRPGGTGFPAQSAAARRSSPALDRGRAVHDGLLKVFAVDDGGRHLVIRANATTGSRGSELGSPERRPWRRDRGAAGRQRDQSTCSAPTAPAPRRSASVWRRTCTARGAAEPVRPGGRRQCPPAHCAVIRPNGPAHPRPAGRSIGEIAQFVNSEPLVAGGVLRALRRLRGQHRRQTVAIQPRTRHWQCCSPEFFKRSPTRSTRSRQPQPRPQVLQLCRLLPAPPAPPVHAARVWANALAGARLYRGQPDKAQDRAAVPARAGSPARSSARRGRQCMSRSPELPVTLSTEWHEPSSTLTRSRSWQTVRTSCWPASPPPSAPCWAGWTAGSSTCRPVGRRRRGPLAD